MALRKIPEIKANVSSYVFAGDTLERIGPNSTVKLSNANPIINGSVGANCKIEFALNATIMEDVGVNCRIECVNELVIHGNVGTNVKIKCSSLTIYGDVGVNVEIACPVEPVIYGDIGSHFKRIILPSLDTPLANVTRALKDLQFDKPKSGPPGGPLVFDSKASIPTVPATIESDAESAVIFVPEAPTEVGMNEAQEGLGSSGAAPIFNSKASTPSTPITMEFLPDAAPTVSSVPAKAGTSTTGMFKTQSPAKSATPPVSGASSHAHSSIKVGKVTARGNVMHFVLGANPSISTGGIDTGGEVFQAAIDPNGPKDVLKDFYASIEMGMR
jgi:hypothetical protein